MKIKSIKSFIIPISIFIVHCSLFIVMTSCSSTTQTNTGNFTGTVILNNDTGNSALDAADYAGVTVALYSPAGLDTTIVRLNRDYPDLGVQISQETEFDHRLQTPVKTATSTAAGSFTISKIPVGKYNLVVMKQGWGVRYLYDIDIAEGDNTIPTKNSQFTKSAVELYPISTLSGYVSDSFEFKTNHSYKIQDNVFLTAGVVFSPGAYIWIDADKKISVYASISTPIIGSDFVRVSTSDGLYGTSQLSASSLQRFYAIECGGTAAFTQDKLSTVITTFAQSGWIINSSNLNISNMVFRHIRNGLLIEQADLISLSRCNIQYANDAENGAFTYSGSDDITSSGLIFKDCTNAIRQHSCLNTDVNNSYFNNISGRGVFNLYETTGSVAHCEFTALNIAIETSGSSNTTITYCYIEANLGIYNSPQLNWEMQLFQANYNNLKCSQYAIKSRAIAFNPAPVVHNCENNYWFTTSVQEINLLIYDMIDEPLPGPTGSMIVSSVDYIPFRTSRVQNTGITR